MVGQVQRHLCGWMTWTSPESLGATAPAKGLEGAYICFSHPSQYPEPGHSTAWPGSCLASPPEPHTDTWRNADWVSCPPPIFLSLSSRSSPDPTPILLPEPLSSLGFLWLPLAYLSPLAFSFSLASGPSVCLFLSVLLSFLLSLVLFPWGLLISLFLCCSLLPSTPHTPTLTTFSDLLPRFFPSLSPQASSLLCPLPLPVTSFCLHLLPLASMEPRRLPSSLLGKAGSSGGGGKRPPWMTAEPKHPSELSLRKSYTSA